MLIFSIFVISLAMAVPRWKTEIQRDRENMAIDRAHQYVEGIKRYYHKFGSYPPNLKRLEETNGIHYLRQPWPDPLTPDGKWKLLQYSDLKNGEIVGGGRMGMPGGANQGQNGASPTASNTSGSIFGGGGIGMNSGMGMNTGMSGGIGGSMGGSNPGGGLFSDTDTSGSDSSSTGATTAATGTEAPGNSTAASTSNASSQSSGSSPSGGQSGGLFGGPSNPGTRQVFGGTGIVGVASTSKKPAIHAFNRKNRPDQWQFVYNPMQDKSLLGPGVGNGPALGQQIGTQPGATSGSTPGGDGIGSGSTGTSSGPGSNPGAGLFGDSGSN